MHWRLAAFLLVLSLVLGGQARAQERDLVAVKFHPVALPLRAHEPMDLRFERVRFAEPSASGRGADKFFDQIEQILAAHGITSNWQYVFPDGAFIRIDIEIRGRRIELASAHTLYERSGRSIATERGLMALEGRDLREMLAKESEAFRNRRLAFEKILALASARVRENLGQ